MIAMSSLISRIFVWLTIFNVNAITAPKEIVEIKNKIDETFSDDLKIKRNLSSNFSIQDNFSNASIDSALEKKNFHGYGLRRDRFWCTGCRQNVRSYISMSWTIWQKWQE